MCEIWTTNTFNHEQILKCFLFVALDEFFKQPGLKVKNDFFRVPAVGLIISRLFPTLCYEYREKMETVLNLTLSLHCRLKLNGDFIEMREAEVTQTHIIVTKETGRQLRETDVWLHAEV